MQAAELESLNSFSVSARCQALWEVDAVETLKQAVLWSREHKLPWLVMGEGSNILFSDDYPGVCIRMAMQGIHFSEADDGSDDVLVEVAAGENWHELVVRCLEEKLYGIENLALIPGSAGAAPVQNIGAYGVELSDVLQSVTVLDSETLQSYRLAANECELSYRGSVFKNRLRGRVIITAMTLKLRRQPRVVAHYPSLVEKLGKRGGEEGGEITPEAVFDAVCAIRRARLPDPAQLGNAGSFFKNPLLPIRDYELLCEQYPDMPSFKTDNAGQVKIPAAWLIEQAGWKGFRDGDAGVHREQALVLVNHGQATGAQIQALAQRIGDSVQEKFAIKLEAEVRIVP